MTQTLETSPISSFNDTAHTDKNFMTEAQSYGASFDAGAHDPDITIEAYPDGSFTIRRGEDILTADNPHGYEKTPALDRSKTTRHLSLVATNGSLVRKVSS